MPIHPQGRTRDEPQHVEASGPRPRFLVNTVIGDSDNLPIDVAIGPLGTPPPN